MDAISPERKKELCDLFGMLRWGLLERRAELLAQKHIILQRLEGLCDVAAAEQKKELNDNDITLKAIDLAVAYRDSDLGKERHERAEYLNDLLDADQWENDDEEDHRRLVAVVWPEIDAIIAAEREEGWRLILANIR
jgi:hypothetical protein